MEKQISCTRPIDRLGRIVIPKEIRRELNISINEELLISLENDGVFITHQHNFCALCGNTQNLIPVKDKYICENCRSELVDQSGNGAL